MEKEVENLLKEIKSLQEEAKRKETKNKTTMENNQTKIEELKKQIKQNESYQKSFSQEEEEYKNFSKSNEELKKQISAIESENKVLNGENMDIRAGETNQEKKQKIEEKKQAIKERLNRKRRFLIINRNLKPAEISEKIDNLNKKQKVLENDIEASKRGVQIEKEVAKRLGNDDALKFKENVLQKRIKEFQKNAKEIQTYKELYSIKDVLKEIEKLDLAMEEIDKISMKNTNIDMSLFGNGKGKEEPKKPEESKKPEEPKENQNTSQTQQQAQKPKNDPIDLVNQAMQNQKDEEAKRQQNKAETIEKLAEKPNYMGKDENDIDNSTNTENNAEGKNQGQGQNNNHNIFAFDSNDLKGLYKTVEDKISDYFCEYEKLTNEFKAAKNLPDIKDYHDMVLYREMIKDFKEKALALKEALEKSSEEVDIDSVNRCYQLFNKKIQDFDVEQEMIKRFKEKKAEIERNSTSRTIQKDRKIFNDMRDTFKKLNVINAESKENIRECANAKLNVDIVRSATNEEIYANNDLDDLEIVIGNSGKIIFDANKYPISKRQMKKAEQYTVDDILSEIEHNHSVEILDREAIKTCIKSKRIDPVVVHCIINNKKMKSTNKAYVLNTYLNDCLDAAENVRIDNNSNVIYDLNSLSKGGKMSLSGKQNLVQRAKMLARSNLGTVKGEYKPTLWARIKAGLSKQKIPEITELSQKEQEEVGIVINEQLNADKIPEKNNTRFWKSIKTTDQNKMEYSLNDKQAKEAVEVSNEIKNKNSGEKDVEIEIR